ncbi:MAG: excinuclease ABC subunit UvrC [Lentisphaeria bacterium]|jgi:excinuclease ABC subunit C
MLRFHSQDVPNRPGVYLFRNLAGDVIYVGKAKSLRKRLASYFQPSRRAKADPKLRALIHSIAAYEMIPLRTESEAFVREEQLIKQYAPRYNIEMRDDKRYLLLCLNPEEPFPRLRLTRLRRQDQRLYWGPVPHATALRDLAGYLAERFGLRTCAGNGLNPKVASHCLKRALGRCIAPCTGGITPADYQLRVAALLAVLNGRTTEVLADLAARMKEAAASHDFEAAARLRDAAGVLKELRTHALNRPLLPPSVRAAGGAGPGQIRELQVALGLAQPPETLECIDVSNIAGTFTVASLVRFRGGVPARKEYRRYRIRTVTGSNDVACIAEVVGRRFTRLREEGGAPPDLLVIDGGAGQLAAARDALRAAGFAGQPVVGLAKRLEEIHFPDRREPLLLDRHSGALRLVQAIRDEAHRFAIAYNRLLRQRRLQESVLDEIPGIGPKRRRELLRTFGSLRRLRAAVPAEIAAAVPGLSEESLRALAERLRPLAGSG